MLDLKRCTAIGIRMARLRVPWQVRDQGFRSIRRGFERVGFSLPPFPSPSTITRPTHPPPNPQPQAAADAILSLDPAAFEGAEDVATVMQCLPTEDERNLLQVGRGVCVRNGGGGG